jgi:hypothetical protein
VYPIGFSDGLALRRVAKRLLGGAPAATGAKRGSIVLFCMPNLTKCILCRCCQALTGRSTGGDWCRGRRPAEKRRRHAWQRPHTRQHRPCATLLVKFKGSALWSRFLWLADKAWRGARDTRTPIPYILTRRRRQTSALSSIPAGGLATGSCAIPGGLADGDGGAVTGDGGTPGGLAAGDGGAVMGDGGRPGGLAPGDGGAVMGDDGTPGGLAPGDGGAVMGDDGTPGGLAAGDGGFVTGAGGSVMTACGKARH